jgi:spore maturation protein CgeB
MSDSLKIAFFGSSIVSAFWNSAATYYRGIVRALANKGHKVTFYESDLYDRQKHRDIADPQWVSVVVYSSRDESAALAAASEARDADVIIRASDTGTFDGLIEKAILDTRRQAAIVAYWDMDPPEVLDPLGSGYLDGRRAVISAYDAVLTRGGGRSVADAYAALGARMCVSIHCALDPATNYPVEPQDRFSAQLAFLGNRRPDREARIESFLLRAAEQLPESAFLLGGSGWDEKPLPPNVRHMGHVYTNDHNAFNSTPLAVLNVTRESVARCGYAPPTRVFEAAGAGACIITDSWRGIEEFLEPGSEILIARDGCEVAEHLKELDADRARSIGEAARHRVLAYHTYAQRVQQLEGVLATVGRGGL